MRLQETPFFSNALWLAITNAGDLRYLEHQPGRITVLAAAYEALELSGWLERRLYAVTEGQQVDVARIHNARYAERAVEEADGRLRPLLEAALDSLSDEIRGE